MPVVSLDHRLRAELAAAGLSDDDRYLDICLILRRDKTKETLLFAGGRWDFADRRFLDCDPEQCKIVDLEESQVPFTLWFAKEWLCPFREGFPRDTSLVGAIGERRGGKTFDLIQCELAAAVDVPLVDGSPLVGWVISANYQERDEVDQTIVSTLPSTWFKYRGQPHYRYTLAHGSTIRSVSANDPDTLKRGRGDILLFNEAQKMSVEALTHGIYGTIDKGGLAMLAANPPRKQRGEWVRTLKEAIDDGLVPSAKFFGFSAKDNTKIDHVARGRVDNIVRVINPKAADADTDGAWLPVGDRAYYKFDRRTHLKCVPELGDVTAELLRRKVGRVYAFLGGVDFQGVPHHAGVVLRAFGDLARPTYFATDEILTTGVEEDFLAEVDDKDRYEPANLLWIGDASGQWQTGGDRTKGRQSFDIFKSQRWHIRPPQLKRTDKGEWSKNPNIADRMNLVNRLLAEGRLFIDPNTCPRLAESIRECELKFHKPHGEHSHITDALGYALFWIEPRPKRSALPTAASVATVSMGDTGRRIY